MLRPKQITHIKRIKPPKFPNSILKASAVKVTPCEVDVSQTPEIRIIKAVAVQIINVSKIGPVIATSPCFTGSETFATPCTRDSVPIPASFEKAPLLTP